MPKGEKNDGPQKTEGLLLHLRAQSKATSCEINDLVLSFFFSLWARYPHRQDAPWYTLKALGPSYLRYSYPVNAALTEGLVCFTDTYVCMQYWE